MMIAPETSLVVTAAPVSEQFSTLRHQMPGYCDSV